MSGSLLRFVGPALVVTIASTGCSEIRGRRMVQEGNKLYRDGQYKEAVAAFTAAEAMVPNFWVLWLNKGYTCRQMLIPGAKTPENEQAANCALAAFTRMRELNPKDERGENLYVQTLFDADRFDDLGKMYEGRIAKNPNDIDSINGLIHTLSKADKLEDALAWYEKKAEIQSKDKDPIKVSEALYGVGVFLWQQLSQKGGGPDKVMFDPRPDPTKPKEVKIPPPTGGGDIVSQQRVDYADKGIAYLKKALEVRPKYPDAMTYINLLYRQKSYAFFDQPDEWQKTVDEATVWMKKSLEAQGRPVPPALPHMEHNATPGGGGGQANDDPDEEAAGKREVTADPPQDKKRNKKKGARPGKRKRGRR